MFLDAQTFGSFTHTDWTSADLDLTAVSGQPACAPKLVAVHNVTTAAEDFEIRDEAGTAYVVSIPPGVYPFLFRGVHAVGDGTGENIVVNVGWDRLARDNA
jgi:hypothetical protein